MQIQLKQTEIETALKDYIQKQGIQLQGRAVVIDFTNGRKENGITADLSISDIASDFPLLAPDEEPQPTLSLVGSSDSLGADPAAEASVPAAVQPVEEGTPTPAKGQSLFGG